MMRHVPALVVVVLAAVIGGVAGGLIVKATWTSGNGNASPATASTGSAASCDAATVAGKALPSVVTVRAGTGPAAGTGSGVVIRASGYVVTNDHVIATVPRSEALTIVRSDGESVGATMVGRDPLTDLAVLKAQDGSGLTAIALGSSSALHVGEPVVAIGSPLGLASTVTSGIVSALDRYVQVPSEAVRTAHLIGAIQTDASINPGNSGGALVDCAARLIGINTAGAALPDSGGGSIGLGFAIPVDFVRHIADELIAEGMVTRASFGMQLQAIPDLGLFVVGVTPGGAAEKAGLRPGDIVVEVDGAPARSVDALTVRTLTMKAGDTLRLTYERRGVRRTTVLTLTNVGPGP